MNRVVHLGAARERLEALSEQDREAACLLALSKIDGVGAVTVLACHRGPGAVRSWLDLVGDRVERSESLAVTLRPRVRDEVVHSARSIDPVAELARCNALGIRVMVHGRPGYPERLVEDPAPPAILFATGPVPGPGVPSVAIVGTRNATTLGRTFARRLGSDLAVAGVNVVSGLALGIDGAAHRGAIDVLAGTTERTAPGPGRPIGVVGAGVDVAYPARHEVLHRDVASLGVILSEAPPGCRPAPWRFPARNRIIAAMSDAVVVVESRATGGSMITADQAGDRGVPVLAVPGHPTSSAAAGTNALIADGARPVIDVDDVLSEIGLPFRSERKSAAAPVKLPASQQVLVDALTGGPLALGELVALRSGTLEEVAADLTMLEAKGLVVADGGWFELSTGTGSSR